MEEKLFKRFELKVIIEKSTTVTTLLKRLVPGIGLLPWAEIYI